MTTAIVPLTPGLWPDFEDLFGKQGACYGCWCTFFRMAPKLRRDNSSRDKKAFIRQRIETGPPPGLLAFEAQKAVGWMQIGPRADVPEWNNHQRSSAPLEKSEAADAAVWAISCFFLRAGARGTGLTHKLVEAGIAFARDHGARVVDACPMELSRDASSVGLFVGSSRVFDKAGFVVVKRKTANRPLMRLEL